MQPRPSEKGHRRGLESNGQTRCGHTHTDISIRTWTAWEKQNESCLQKHRPCLAWTYFQGDTNLPDGISGCQKHTEGVTGVAALHLERSPGWVPVPAFPLLGYHRRCISRRCISRPQAPRAPSYSLPSRKGTVWPPEGSGEANPYPSPPFPLPARPTCAPLYRAAPAPCRDLDCLCFSILGVGFMPWEHHHPRKGTFQCAFPLLCISLRTGIHLVRNMQF